MNKLRNLFKPFTLIKKSPLLHVAFARCNQCGNEFQINDGHSPFIYGLHAFITTCDVCGNNDHHLMEKKKNSVPIGTLLLDDSTKTIYTKNSSNQWIII